MTTLAELRAAVELLLELPAIGTLLQLNSNTPERAYEAYTLSLCAEAVRRANGQVELIGVQSGINPATVVFRGAPGSMSSTAQNFCYVRCTLGAQQFEIHVDVEYEGQTRATHEIDVSVVDGQHCNSVRATGRSPKTNKLVMLFECKFYQGSTPGVDLARGFVGLRDDCTQSHQLSGFVSNTTTPNLRNYLSKKTSPIYFNPLPSDPASEERFIRNVEQTLRRWARV